VLSKYIVARATIGTTTLIATRNDVTELNETVSDDGREPRDFLNPVPGIVRQTRRYATDRIIARRPREVFQLRAAGLVTKATIIRREKTFSPAERTNDTDKRAHV